MVVTAADVFPIDFFWCVPHDLGTFHKCARFCRYVLSLALLWIYHSYYASIVMGKIISVIFNAYNRKAHLSIGTV